MSAPEIFDAIVIGAGVNGLAAAAYLAKAGKRVVVLERSGTLGGLAQNVETDRGFLVPYAAPALYAVDPVLLKDFRTIRKGLAFAVRDMPLAGFSEAGSTVLIGRDMHATARSIAAFSQSDAKAWPAFRKEAFGLARAMRKLWWTNETFDPTRLSRAQQVLLSHLQTASAVAWLDERFESDLLKATLAFDAGNPSEPGSALTLVWRAAQEMCGLQGAVAIPRRGVGALTRLLAEAASNAGAVVQMVSPVSSILAGPNGATGVMLANGEAVHGRAVVSTLPRDETMLGLARDIVPFAAAQKKIAKASVGTALVTATLNDAPHIDAPLNSRFVFADSCENFIAARMAARAGALPDTLLFEAVLSSASDISVAPPEHHVLSMLIHPVPLSPSEGWDALKPKLTAKAVAALDRLSPGIVAKIADMYVSTPADYPPPGATVTPTRLMARWKDRIETDIPGLLFAGADAEPVAAVSGRAGRIAASLIGAKA